MAKTMDELIVRWLGSRGASDFVLPEMSLHPDQAVAAILGFRGPYPADMHPIDAHADYLTALLAALLKQCPDVLAQVKPAALRRGQYTLISAAIMTGDPRFADAIIAGLKATSVLTKLMVVEAVQRHAWLRTPAARAELERLATLPSIASSAPDRAKVAAALAAFERGG